MVYAAAVAPVVMLLSELPDPVTMVGNRVNINDVSALTRDDMELSVREVPYPEHRRSPKLTRREVALLELLALGPGRVFACDEIIDRLWTVTAEWNTK